jgi:hypothetical protein
MPNLTYNAGLYTFAPPSAIYTEVLKAYYPMKPYNKEEFAKAIAELPTEARGRTEIQRALLGLEPVLKGLSGKTVIFLFTDGINTEIAPTTVLTPNVFARTPWELASDLAEKYDVCFHVISSAPGEIEKRLVEAVAQINECSHVVPLDDLLEHPDYITGSLFVMDEKVLEVIRTQEKIVDTDRISSREESGWSGRVSSAHVHQLTLHRESKDETYWAAGVCTMTAGWPRRLARARPGCQACRRVSWSGRRTRIGGNCTTSAKTGRRPTILPTGCRRSLPT